MLRLPTDNFSLVMSARMDPHLPLARMRATGALGERRAAGLRFAREEIRSLYLLDRGSEPDGAVVTRIHALPEAPPAGRAGGGCRRAGAPRRAGPAAWSAWRRRSRRAITATSWNSRSRKCSRSNPSACRRSCSGPRVEGCRPGLAASLMGNGWDEASAAAAIENLLRADLFVSEIGDDGWSRYHPLIVEMPRHRLQVVPGERELAALHRRAAAWFADHGFVDRAIDQYLEAGLPGAAAAPVADQVHGALDREQWRDLDRWLRRLPDALVEAPPRLLLARAGAPSFPAATPRPRPTCAWSRTRLPRAPPSPASGWGPRARCCRSRSRRALDAYPDGSLADARRAGALIPADRRLATALVLIAISMVAFLLRALSRPIVSAFAGIAFPHAVATWSVQRQRQAWARAERSGSDALPTRDDAGSRRARAWVQRSFPREDEDTRPTRFGNVLATAVEHPKLAYTMEGLIWWPRLAQLVPAAFRDALGGAQAPMMGLPNLCTVFAALAIGLAASHGCAAGAWAPAVLCLVVGAVIAWLCYRAAVSQAAELGRLLRVGFDLYRHEILRQLDIEVPADQAAERAPWAGLTAALLGISPMPNAAPAGSAGAADAEPAPTASAAPAPGGGSPSSPLVAGSQT